LYLLRKKIYWLKSDKCKTGREEIRLLAQSLIVVVESLPQKLCRRTF